jgi:Ca2+/Na+ antiporter
LKFKSQNSAFPSLYTVGLKDEITAITFVALGTSLPDTFASKTAAANEKTADNAIGNVTGSNSVNVFMGLGIPWMIASIYWAVVVSRLTSNIWLMFCLLAVVFYLCLTRNLMLNRVVELWISNN